MDTTVTTKLNATGIALARLHPHPAQPRTTLDVQDMAGLIASLQANGWMEDRPMTIVPAPEVGPDEYYMVKGHRRALAWLLLKTFLPAEGHNTVAQIHEWLDAVFLPTEPGGLMGLYGKFGNFPDVVVDQVAELKATYAQQCLWVLADNFNAETPDTMGIIRSLDVTHRQAKVPMNQIAQAIGKSQAWVSQHLGLLELSKELQDAVAAKTLAIGGVLAIAKLKGERRAAADAFYTKMVVEKSGWSGLSVNSMQETCGRFANWKEPTVGLTYNRPAEYWQALIMSRVWQQALAADPAKAWYSAFFAPLANGNTDVNLIHMWLDESYILGREYYNKSIDWKRLLKEFAPENQCEGCPLMALPHISLDRDFDKNKYPCRVIDSLEGCINAPLEPAPQIVEAPYSWKTHGWLPVAEALAAWEEERASAKSRNQEEKSTAPGEKETPVKKQRAQIRHFMENHMQLDYLHPLATNCATCEFKLAGTPVKSQPTCPHCQWAARSKDVGFFVRTPKEGIGTAIPVCRQYRRRGGDDWVNRIPEATHDLSYPRPLICAMTLNLAMDIVRHVYQGQRTVLETFTGRGLTKDVHMTEAWPTAFKEMEPLLSDRQLVTLFAWVFGEWQGNQYQNDGTYGAKRSYPLLVADTAVSYEDLDWGTYWQRREAAAAKTTEPTAAAKAFDADLEPDEEDDPENTEADTEDSMDKEEDTENLPDDTEDSLDAGEDTENPLADAEDVTANTENLPESKSCPECHAGPGCHVYSCSQLAAIRAEQGLSAEPSNGQVRTVDEILAATEAMIEAEFGPVKTELAKAEEFTALGPVDPAVVAMLEPTPEAPIFAWPTCPNCDVDLIPCEDAAGGQHYECPECGEAFTTTGEPLIPDDDGREPATTFAGELAE